LDPPQAVLSLHLPQRVLQFRLGYKTPVGEKVYVQLVGDNGVYVTEAAVLDLLPRQDAEWRDAAFINLTGLRFDRLRIAAGARDFELGLDSVRRRWQLVRPRTARADGQRIERALQQALALRVERFVQDQPGVDLEPYGLHQPALTLAFFSGTNQVFGAEFGRSPSNDTSLVYARRSDYPNVVLVSRQVVETLAVPYTEFLDYRLLDQGLEATERIEVRAAEAFTLARQTSGVWRVTAPREFSADPALMRAFLDRMQNLSIVEVAKEVVTDLDLPNYGLAAPALQYGFYADSKSNSAGGVPLVQVEFGTNRDDRVYVRRGDENPVYGTKLEEVQMLPRAAFELRDRRLWNFTTNDVSGVTIHLRGQDYQLRRAPGGQWSFANGSQGIVNTFALEEAMHRFGLLWAKAWIAQGKDRLGAYGFDTLDHRLAIELHRESGSQTLQVGFGATSMSGGPYAWVELEGEPIVFEFPFEVFYVYQDAIRSLTARGGSLP
jgi:hypothetical protein